MLTVYDLLLEIDRCLRAEGKSAKDVLVLSLSDAHETLGDDEEEAEWFEAEIQNGEMRIVQWEATRGN